MRSNMIEFDTIQTFGEATGRHIEDEKSMIAVMKRHKRTDKRGTSVIQNLPFYNMKGQEWRKERSKKT